MTQKKEAFWGFVLKCLENCTYHSLKSYFYDNTQDLVLKISDLYDIFMKVKKLNSFEVQFIFFIKDEEHFDINILQTAYEEYSYSADSL